MLVVFVVIKAPVWAAAVVNMLAVALPMGVAMKELTGIMVGTGDRMLACIEIVVSRFSMPAPSDKWSCCAVFDF